jgi:hypothetical protein
VAPPGGLGEVRRPIAMLEARADQRAEHAEPEQRDGAPVVVFHGGILSKWSGH